MSRLPDLVAWAVFAKVAELGSFARAADDLKLSKPTVSKTIARLEARVGVPLFHRTSRRLAVTDSGRVALERAQRILADGAFVEAQLSTQAEEPSGQVRMTAPMSFGVQRLGRLLPEFLETYPDISIDLHLGDAQEDLIANHYDLVLRISSLADSSLRARKLCDVPRPIVAAPRYLERYGAPEHPRDLRTHRTILYANSPTPDVWRLRHGVHGEWEGRVGGRLVTNNADVILPALVAGHAIAVQPIFSVQRELEDGSLREILPGWSLPPIALYLVTPPGALRPSRVKALIDFLVARLGRGALFAGAA